MAWLLALFVVMVVGLLASIAVYAAVGLALYAAFLAARWAWRR